MVTTYNQSYISSLHPNNIVSGTLYDAHAHSLKCHFSCEVVEINSHQPINFTMVMMILKDSNAEIVINSMVSRVSTNFWISSFNVEIIRS